MSLADWKARLQAAGLRVAGEKPVNYGVQLRLDDGESEALLTVYQGDRKSVV